MATSRTDVHYGKVAGALRAQETLSPSTELEMTIVIAQEIQLPSSIKLNLNEWYTAIKINCILMRLAVGLDKFKPKVDVWFAKLAKCSKSNFSQ